MADEVEKSEHARICPSCGNIQLSGGRCYQCGTWTKKDDSRERFLAGLDRTKNRRRKR